MSEDIRQVVLAALAEAAPGLKLDGLDPARPFRDQLDIDSVDYLNFVLGLERHFGLRVPETEYPSLSSLDGCVRYLGTLGIAS